MEVFLFFVGGTFLIIVLAWLFRTSERMEKLEKTVASLRAQLARLEKAQEDASAASAESPDESEALPSEQPAPETQRSQFTEAKQRAAESTHPKTPPPIPEPSEKDEPEPVASNLAKEDTPPETPAPLSPLAPPPPQVPKGKASRSQPEPGPSPSPKEPVEPEPPLIEWRPLLEKLKLWPPSGESAEAAIVGWWATRIGIVSLIISAVFAGIRFSEQFPPWLWVLMLAVIAAGLTGLGEWLERRLQSFGRVISAGGLSLGYFTAFAAFALPAMKIIHDPVLGVIAQLAALAAIIAWSLWKEDKSLAALAVLLGFVSCGFSHHHDLDNFVIAGLLILAAGGGLFLVLRNWLWPHAIATAGSWGGFLILSVGEWTWADEAPEFFITLGSLVLLAIILEAANFIAHDRGGDDADSRPRERKWLAVANTSAAIAVGWIATRETVPQHLDLFFLLFAFLLFGFTAMRFWRGHPTGITETFFLKAVALLALFFVERFDGPTRWLSLAVEAGAVLWTFHRTRLRWVEIGFAAVFLGSLGFIWKDVMIGNRASAWPLDSFPSAAGAGSLVLLSLLLGLHSLWSSVGEKPKLKKDSNELGPETDPVMVFRMLSAAFVGFAAASFAFSLKAGQPEISQPVYLSILALALAAPGAFLRRFPPILAGLAALIPAYFSFFELGESRGVAAAVWLMLLAFGLAETAYRFWLKRWHFGNAIRLILHGLGILTLADLIFRLEIRLEFGTAAAVLAALLFALVGSVALIGQSRTFPKGHASAGKPAYHHLSQLLLSILAGGGGVFVTLELTGDSIHAATWLAISAAILFASAFRTRSPLAAVAGGLPFVTGIVVYAVEFADKHPLGEQLLTAVILIAVSLGTTAVLWRFAGAEKDSVVSKYQLILQASAIFVLHWVFRSHLEPSAVFLADALLAVGVTALGTVPPFRTIPILSGLPLVLALLHAALVSLDGEWGPRTYWWPAAAVIFGWVWYFGRTQTAEPAGSKLSLQDINRVVAAMAVTLCGYHALDNPWHLVALTGFALIFGGLWRWQTIERLHVASAIPLGVAVIGALLRLTNSPPDDQTAGLTSILLVAAGLAGHGLLLAWKRPRLLPVTWIHGFTSLLLAFVALAPRVMGVDKLTTVFWGLAAIVLFATGFISGLRSFRVAGLTGLGLCLVRMILIDIEDPLYRIFAFLGTAVVLLATGYLYQRFRHLVDRPDPVEKDAG